MSITVCQCKVCTSRHRDMIEQMSMQGFSPEKIYNHLQELTDPADKQIVAQENIKPASIRRHLRKHFDPEEDDMIQDAGLKSRVKTLRKDYNEGRKINVDKANTIAQLIKLALINIEEVEKLSNAKKHQYTISYMAQIKGLIDELNKVSGAIKEEGTIDANFYRDEIDNFAKIVLATIRALDTQFGMNMQLETAFAEEFSQQYALFREREKMIFAGELSPKDNDKNNNVNTFNDANSLV